MMWIHHNGFYLAECRAYVRMALEIGSANREK